MDGATFSFEGYEIPVDLANLTGGGPDTFGTISDRHIEHLRKHAGLWANQRIVEIGCGIGRDAIPLTKILDVSGHYIGIDVTKASIEWCRHNLSKRHPNFGFVHCDVADKIYNPQGAMVISDCMIPTQDGSTDLIIAQSVLTHMLEDGIRHYLGEFARVLKKEGIAYLTCFVVDEEIRKSIKEKPATVFDLDFQNDYSDGCFINVLDCPTAAVAYSLPKLEKMVKSAGLIFRKPLLRGHWSGVFTQADCGQDTMILGRE